MDNYTRELVRFDDENEMFHNLRVLDSYELHKLNKKMSDKINRCLGLILCIHEDTKKIINNHE